MIEVLPVLFVVAVGVASYAGARLYTANPAHHSAARDLARLKTQRAWLTERLQQARHESWDDAMVTQITDQLAFTEAELIARVSPLAPPRPRTE